MMIEVDNVHVFTVADDAGDDAKMYEFPQKLTNRTVWAIAMNQMKAEQLLEEYVKEHSHDIEGFFLASVAKVGEHVAAYKRLNRRYSVHDRMKVLKLR